MLPRENSHKPVPKFTSFQLKDTSDSLPNKCGKGKLSSKDRSVGDRAPGQLAQHGEPVYHHHASRLREKSSREPHYLDKDLPSRSQSFTIDTRGDNDNLRYGSLHRYSIPQYYRSGAGRILGLPNSWKIDRDGSSDSHISVLSSHSDHNVRRTAGAFRDIAALKEFRIRPLPSQNQVLQLDQDFLPLQTEDLNEDGTANKYRSAKCTETDYRSIEGPAKPSNTPEDPDLISDWELHDARGSASTQTAQETSKDRLSIQLLKAVEDEPENGQAWLDLIAHKRQNHSQPSMEKSYAGDEALALAETVTDLVGKALKVVRSESSREQLTVELMRETSLVWEPNRVKKKWEQMLSKNPGYIRLWLEYVDYLQSTSSVFLFEEVKQVFTKALDVLRDIRPGPSNSQQFIVETQCYLLLRATLFIWEAGFSELAVSIWQGNLELILSKSDSSPGASDQPTEAPLLRPEDLEDFWESEVARIGEDGACGILSYNKGQITNAVSSAETREVLPHKPTIEDWGGIEAREAKRSSFPARTSDDIEESDPYRIILFSDLKPFLLYIDRQYQDVLLHAFLAFCHLPPLIIGKGGVACWWRNPFVRNDSLHYNQLIQSSEKESEPSKNIAVHSRPGVAYFALSLETLFNAPDAWFAAFPEPAKTLPNFSWACRVLRTLVKKQTRNDSSLAVYLLGLELRNDPKSVSKLAKSLLKQHPSSLRLYSAYALVEHRLGRSEVADRVSATAINMMKDHEDVPVLWLSWIWRLVEAGRVREALARFYTFCDSEIKPELTDEQLRLDASSGTAMLRVQKMLLHCRDHMLSTRNYTCAEQHMELLILLQYVSRTASLEFILSTLSTNLDLLSSTASGKSSSPQGELLLQFQAKLIYHHITSKAPFSPLTIRSALLQSITLFPFNTIFLSLFSFTEQRFRLDDRVRATVQSILQPPGGAQTEQHEEQSILTHFFAIQNEQHRASMSLGASVHSVRSAFERAVRSRSGRRSAALWRQYFLFEFDRGGDAKEQAAARAIFYRAIRACPWVKDLYLLAFRHLGDVMERTELREIYELLLEKELRVRVTLDGG